MASADGTLVVTFNGEIYNYQRAARRTRSRRRALPHEFRYGSASAPLRAPRRRRWCTGCAACSPSRIWDETRRELFLARDPYGIKPLYTANDGWTFRFASQVKALLAGGEVSRDPEPAGIAGFHLFGSVPEPFTLYRDIRALPAGHTQRIDAAGPREPRPFANLAAILASGCRGARPLPPNSRERLRAAARDSVRAPHLLADVEVGIFLSAGVDSGCASRPDGGCRPARDPRHHARFRRVPRHGGGRSAARREVAERYGARHIVRRVDEREFREDLPAIIEAMDQPSIDGVNTWFVAKAAKEAGAQGRAVRARRRRALRPGIRALSICRAGAAVSVPSPRCRGSGGWPAR